MFLLACTRRVMLDAGFLRTMKSMMAVANDKPYLCNVSNDDECHENKCQDEELFSSVKRTM